MINIGKIIGKFIRNSSQREIDQLKLIVKKILLHKQKSEKYPIKISQLKLQNSNQKLKMEQN